MGLDDIDPELEDALGGGEDNEGKSTDEQEVNLHLKVKGERKEGESLGDFARRMAARYQGILNSRKGRKIKVRVPNDVEELTEDG